MLIKHPLAVGTKVEAKKMRCNCSGGGFTMITSTIAKVIQNKTGYWYYLSNGTTIRAEWVVSLT